MLTAVSVFVLVACLSGSGAAETCGVWPTATSAGLGVATPSIASPTVGASTPVVVVGVWRDCVQPAAITVSRGALIQWQAAGPFEADVAFEDGTAIGRIRHVLEFRMDRPGSYVYFVNTGVRLRGTIEVRP